MIQKTSNGAVRTGVFFCFIGNFVPIIQKCHKEKEREEKGWKDIANRKKLPAGGVPRNSIIMRQTA